MPAGKWWEKAKDEEVTCKWQHLLTDDGLDYYVNVETNETQWDKPEELMTEDEMNESGGEWVWVPHPTEVFTPAQLVSSRGKDNRCRLKDGTEATYKKSECLPLKKASLKRVVADLTLLDEMHAPLILHNLRARFARRDIYTNVGTILISTSSRRFARQTPRNPSRNADRCSCFPHVCAE